MALTFPQSVQEPIKMHTLIKFGIVPFDGHALWNPARQSMKVNTLKSNNTHTTDLGLGQTSNSSRL